MCKKKKYSKPQELKNVSLFHIEAGNRLHDFVANIGPLLNENNGTFYPRSEVVIRSIIPIIDMLSSQNAKRRRKILKELGIVYPEIFWYSVRHGLVHSSKQPQSLKIKHSRSGFVTRYDWEQSEITSYANTQYSINPKLLYESTKSWLEKCQHNPTYKYVKYTYMLNIDKKTPLLFKEILEAQNKDKNMY